MSEILPDDVDALRRALESSPEDVTVTLLLDASASMASGRPEKLLFAKRAAAALGYIGLASEDRVSVTALSGRVARRRVALRGSGRVFRLLADLSAISVADGPTDLLAAARHAAAQLHGRGVVVLLSDLLDPHADRVIRDRSYAERCADKFLQDLFDLENYRGTGRVFLP